VSQELLKAAMAIAYSGGTRDFAAVQVSIRQHTSAYVSIRQHTSAYVSIRVLCLSPTPAARAKKKRFQ
jgi:hypothetical protein